LGLCFAEFSDSVGAEYHVKPTPGRLVLLLSCMARSTVAFPAWKIV
jgi:hypothetical protein